MIINKEQRARLTTPERPGVAAPRNGCFDHDPYRERVPVRDGVSVMQQGRGVDGVAVYAMRYIPIDNPMSKQCQYTRSKKTNADARCEGCIWKTTNPDQP